MVRATLLSFLLLALLSIAAATKSSRLRLTQEHPKRCLNIGSWFADNGPFEAELGLIQYRREPRVITLDSGDVSRTSFNRAFRVQRSARVIRFSVKVSPKFRYTVTTAHAEIVDKFCKSGARVVEVSVNGESKVVDVFKKVGCRAAAFVTFKNVKPSRNGLINVRVKGIKGPAAIAGICIGRTFIPDPKPSRGPKPSRMPKPSSSSTPSEQPRPSESSTPKPSASNSPGPSQSNTPAPSASSSPAPSLSNAPAPTPSSSPKPPFGPSKCTQLGCVNFQGHGDYSVIGNSMSYDEDRENCAIKSSSSTWYTLPTGAVVKKAILFWSASGRMTKHATAHLNNNLVSATRTYFGGSSGYHFYGAEADVTHLVRGSGDYTVSGVWYDNRGLLCTGNAAYAAWSLVIVYEKMDLPLARINVCTDNFRFTFPAGVYSSYVDCVEGFKDSKARTTVVTFESDAYKGEHFFINQNFKGDNVFKGNTAPNLDIVTFDISEVVRTLVTRITYTIKSYFVRTRFGGAIEGLFMPIRVVYHTLPH